MSFAHAETGAAGMMLGAEATAKRILTTQKYIPQGRNEQEQHDQDMRRIELNEQLVPLFDTSQNDLFESCCLEAEEQRCREQELEAIALPKARGENTERLSEKRQCALIERCEDLRSRRAVHTKRTHYGLRGKLRFWPLRASN
jgi:hypothetical protein